MTTTSRGVGKKTYPCVYDPSVIVTAVEEWLSLPGNSPKAPFALTSDFRPLKSYPSLTCLWLVSGGSSRVSEFPFISLEVLYEAARRLLNEHGLPTAFVDSVGQWVRANAVYKPTRVVIPPTRPTGLTVNPDEAVISTVVKVSPLIVVSDSRPLPAIERRVDVVQNPLKFLNALAIW